MYSVKYRLDVFIHDYRHMSCLTFDLSAKVAYGKLEEVDENKENGTNIHRTIGTLFLSKCRDRQSYCQCVEVRSIN